MVVELHVAGHAHRGPGPGQALGQQVGPGGGEDLAGRLVRAHVEEVQGVEGHSAVQVAGTDQVDLVHRPGLDAFEGGIGNALGHIAGGPGPGPGQARPGDGPLDGPAVGDG